MRKVFEKDSNLEISRLIRSFTVLVLMEKNKLTLTSHYLISFNFPIKK
jgi:hypothetical protein